MGFHENLIQTFQNFKDTFLGSTDISNIGDGKATGAISALNSEKQGVLTAGENITIETIYEYTEITTDCSIVTSASALPSSGTADIYYICQDNGDVYTWDADDSDYVKSTELSASFVASKPAVGSEDVLYVLTTDNSVWSCTVTPNTISAEGGGTDYSSEISSLSIATSELSSETTVLSSEVNTQTSLLGSLSISTSELASNIASTSTVQSTLDSTQNSSISSLSIATSELASENTVLTSEVATKQDILTAGAGITITNNVISSSATGAKFEVVQSLPVSDIDPQTIYLVPNTSSQQENIYDEYIYVNNSWELIGSTSVDLTNYYNKSEVNSLFTSQSVVDSTQNSQISSLSTSASEIASNIASMSTSQSEINSNFTSQINSLTSENSTQTSELTSLSTENSTQTTTIFSLSTENSTQTSEINSLSTAASELSSETTVLASEVATKQDELTAGDGIEITAFGNQTIIKSSGAVIYANALYPSGS